MSSAEIDDMVSGPMSTRRASGLGMGLATLAAFVLLTLNDMVLRCLGFKRLHRMVSWWPVLGRRWDVARARSLSDATDRAATLYFKHPWCLQRSSSAVLLLRCMGFPAQLVIGVRRVPFYAHAWMELNGEVINDSSQRIEKFQVMERC